MLLSDHLDMVGFELRATHTQTRKVNGDILQERVQNIVGAWKSGKFMPISQRPYSINTYCLSKVWYKSNVMDLRAADITSINSKVKSWLYSDCHLGHLDEMKGLYNIDHFVIYFEVLLKQGIL